MERPSDASLRAWIVGHGKMAPGVCLKMAFTARRSLPRIGPEKFIASDRHAVLTQS